MYSISNKQYSDIMKILSAFTQLPPCGGDIQAKNRRRKAMLLMRDLKKRKQYDKRFASQVK